MGAPVVNREKRKMAKARKVIITCAVTGAIHTPSMSPHLPVTPDEIIADALGAEIVNVSHHLSVLRENNIVHHEKKGRFVFYTLHPNVYRAGSGTEVLEVNNVRLEIMK